MFPEVELIAVPCVTFPETSMSETGEPRLPPRVKKKKKVVAPAAVAPESTGRTKPPDSGRAMSYVFGVFFLLLGGGMMLGYEYLQRAPAKIFNLLMAGGAGALLSGLGLLIYPLTEEQLDVFQKEPNPVSVFKAMPGFWKFWLLLIGAAMIAGFVYVSQTTVRLGR